MSIEHAMNKKLQIHNSTAEFFIFQIENKEEGIEVLYQDESLWLTQDAIAVLFDKSRSTITEHLQNIFQSQELQEDSVCRKFRRTASDGKSYATKYYKFAIRGYVVDKKRFEKYRIIQDRLFQSDFDKYQTDNLLGTALPYSYQMVQETPYRCRQVQQNHLPEYFRKTYCLLW